MQTSNENVSLQLKKNISDIQKRFETMFVGFKQFKILFCSVIRVQALDQKLAQRLMVSLHCGSATLSEMLSPEH